MVIVRKKRGWFGRTAVTCQSLGSGIQIWIASFKYSEDADIFIAGLPAGFIAPDPEHKS